MPFDQVTFVLALQVESPTDREFELHAASDQDIDPLGIVKADEIVFDDELQAVDQLRVVHFGEELQVVLTVIEGIADQVLQKVLGQFHVVFQLEESDFRLDHPELGQVARGVRVFGSERRAERIDLRQGQRAEFAFELAGDGQVAGFPEEILAVIDRAFRGFGHIVQVERSDAEHRSGAFGVAAGDQRRMQVEKSVVVEIFVDRVSHRMADTEHGAESVGTRAQIGYFAQEFERMAFLLQRVRFGIGGAVDLDRRSLYFDGLAGAERFDQRAGDFDATAGGDLLEEVFVEFGYVGYDLDIMDDRAVVDGDESYVFISAFGSDPAFDDYFRTERR